MQTGIVSMRIKDFDVDANASLVIETILSSIVLQTCRIKTMSICQLMKRLYQLLDYFRYNLCSITHCHQGKKFSKCLHDAFGMFQLHANTEAHYTNKKENSPRIPPGSASIDSRKDLKKRKEKKENS